MTTHPSMPVNGRPTDRAVPARQRAERNGFEHYFIEGTWGTFGRSNVAGLNQGIINEVPANTTLRKAGAHE